MDFHHLRGVDVDTADEAVETVVGEQLCFSARVSAIPFCNFGLKAKRPYRQSYRPSDSTTFFIGGLVLENAQPLFDTEGLDRRNYLLLGRIV